MTSFTDLFNLTRAGAGGRFNSLGVFEMVPAGQPRLDFDPVSLAMRGLQVEEQRTNLILQSGNLADAAWNKSNCAVTANAVRAPDGTITAGKVVGAAGVVASRFVASSAATASNTTVTGSIFVQAGEYTKFRLNLSNFSSESRGVFIDVATGSIYQTDASGSDFTNISGTVTNVGYGWYHCTVTALKGSVNTVVRLVVDPKDNSGASAGDGVSGFYAWGGQLEIGSFRTSHIPTTSAQVTRPADLIQFKSLSPWFNAGTGTIYVEALAAAMPVTAPPHAFQVVDPLNNNQFRLMQSISGEYAASVIADGTEVALLAQSATATVRKWAMVYALNDFALSVSGKPPVTDVSGGLPSGVDRGYIGTNSAGRYWNGHIRRVRFYPRRLTNQELKDLTA